MVQFIKWVDKLLEAMLVVAMSGILLAVTWQVLSRYLLADPSSFTEELARFLLIWIGLLGAAYAYRTRAHLGLNLVVANLAPARRRVAMMLIEVIVIVFAGLAMFYGGSELVALTLELHQISATLGIPMGLVYAVLPLSGGLIVIYAIYHLVMLADDERWEEETWK